jgi:molybdopterin-guanine dinucleotide biosynthesis protein
MTKVVSLGRVKIAKTDLYGRGFKVSDTVTDHTRPRKYGSDRIVVSKGGRYYETTDEKGKKSFIDIAQLEEHMRMDRDDI